MEATETLDCSRLLGFAALGENLAGAIDFREATVDARLGAKVGVEPVSPQDTEKPAE